MSNENAVALAALDALSLSVCLANTTIAKLETENESLRAQLDIKTGVIDQLRDSKRARDFAANMCPVRRAA